MEDKSKQLGDSPDRYLPFLLNNSCEYLQKNQIDLTCL